MHKWTVKKVPHQGGQGACISQFTVLQHHSEWRGKWANLKRILQEYMHIYYIRSYTLWNLSVVVTTVRQPSANMQPCWPEKCTYTTLHISTCIKLPGRELAEEAGVMSQVRLQHSTHTRQELRIYWEQHCSSEHGRHRHMCHTVTE